LGYHRAVKKLLASLLFFSCSRDRVDAKASDLALEPLPAPQGTSKVSIRQLRGTGPDDVWAVALSTVEGRSGRELYAQGYHFDGKAWSYVEVPARTTAIAPVARNDVWAVGRYGMVAHWDGAAWHEDKLPVDHDLVDVAAGGGQVWVSDMTAALHRFDGKRWDVVQPEALADTKVFRLFSVAGQVFAPNSFQKRYAIARFDGTDWRRELVGDRAPALIVGTGPSDLWGIGGSEAAFHFDGTGWKRTETPATSKDYVIGAAAASPTQAWAVGDNGLVMRWDGTSWRRLASGTKARMWAVWAAPGGPVFIGGDDGMLRAPNG
jgi:hypothetical protein